MFSFARGPSDLVRIFISAHRAFHQATSTPSGKFCVHQRTIDEIKLLAQFHQPLVHIQNRHMASRAAIQPNRSQSYPAHCLGLPHLVQVRKKIGILSAPSLRLCPFRTARRSDTPARTCRNWCTLRRTPGLIQIGNHARLDAAAHHVPGVRALDLRANANTARAEDAAVVIQGKPLVRSIHGEIRIAVGKINVSKTLGLGQRLAIRTRHWTRKRSTHGSARQTAVPGSSGGIS